MSNKKRILLVEDDPNFGIILRDFLKMNEYDVILAKNGMEGFEKFKKFEFNLCILDVMMPDLDGLQLLRMIRTDNLLQKTPVIMLTAKSGVEDRIKGLEQGADDYLSKPFDAMELILRIQSLLKRVSEKKNDHESRIMMGKVILDEEDYSITISGEKKEFTLTEFKLLHYFMKRRGRVQTRDNLLLGVWKFDTDVETRTVDVHIRRVRKKIEESSLEIETIRGVGYRLIEQIN